MNSSLKARVSFIMLLVTYTRCSREKFCYSISSETINSHLIAISAISLSFQVWYNLQVLSRQEQDTANLCSILTLRTCLHHRIWWRSCSTAPKFAFIIKMDGLSPNHFKGVHMNDIPIVVVLLTLKILLYDIHIVVGKIIGELVRRSV